MGRAKFYDWRQRYGKANEHNALVPRDHWLTDEEKRAIIAFHERFLRKTDDHERADRLMVNAGIGGS